MILELVGGPEESLQQYAPKFLCSNVLMYEYLSQRDKVIPHSEQKNEFFDHFFLLCLELVLGKMGTTVLKM